MIGVGTDLVDVARFREVLARTPSLVERVFTPGERAYAGRAGDPTERLAVRFAAKEAAMKALGVGLGAMRMADIEVVVDPDSSAPSLLLHGDAADLAASRGVTTWHLSLTHTDTTAHAIAIADG
jgi:holo-[acyl-carrier protein] synthase